MAKKNNIYLIGSMGSGKTSIGKQLAKLTKHPYYDSDEEIERQTGVTVSWIFEVEGEAGFRQRETAVIKTLCQRDHIILSTGGGVVVTPENREVLSQNGMVVYLTVSLNEQYARTRRRKGVRPLLAQPNPKGKLKELNEKREALYCETADIIVDTNNLTPKAIAKKILAKLVIAKA